MTANELRALIAAAQERLAAANDTLTAVSAQVDEDFRNLPRSVEAMAAQNIGNAQLKLDIDKQIEEIKAKIKADGRGPPVNVFLPLQGTDHRNIDFPLLGVGRNRELRFSSPMIFVVDRELTPPDGFEPVINPVTDFNIEARVRAAWRPIGALPIPSKPVDLVQAESPRPGDVHEVHQMVLSADSLNQSGTYHAILEEVLAELPSVRALVPDVEKAVIRYTEEFKEQGIAAAFALGTSIGIDFSKAKDQSGGLVAPTFTADVISPLLGPLAKDALSGGLDDLKSALGSTTLLGIHLADLVAAGLPDAPGTPQIVPIMNGQLPSGVKMTWQMPLHTSDFFRAGPSSNLDLTVIRATEQSVTTCVVSDFTLAIPGAEPLVEIGFSSIEFRQNAGETPEIKFGHIDIGFGGAMQLLRKLLETVQEFIGGAAPTITASSAGVAAEYALTLPPVTAGAFVMRNIAVHVGIDVPFNDKPVTIALGFARRSDPFNLSVLMFGGGGYIDFTIGPAGLIGLEASMEFGAMVAVDFVVAKGEVHALGGVRFELSNGAVRLAAFIRIGGSVEVLGLVSVAVELVVTLEYVNDPVHHQNRLTGRATLVIEVDVTLFSERVELDSGTWTLAGDEGERAVTHADGAETHFAAERVAERAARRADPARQATMLDNWQRYRGAFA